MKKLRWWLPATVMTLGIVTAAAVGLWFELRYQTLESRARSMEPTVQQGDQLTLLDTDGEVRRGDLVTFSTASWENGEAPMLFLDRVVAVGGDTVAGDAQGRLRVNGIPVDEDYVRLDGPVLSFTAQVPAGSVFVLGDWRDDSVDSRMYVTEPDHGAIPVSDVRARVVAINGDTLVPTRAFVDAGLPGEAYQDNRTTWLLVIAGGVALAVAGLVWLVLVVARPRRP